MSKASQNISLTITIESWFIPIDIITNLFVLVGLILAIIYLFIIIIDKTCHTVPMLLVGNTCLIGIAFGICAYTYNLITYINDTYSIFKKDRLCDVFPSITYAICANFNISFLLQAIYRYIRVVYPNRLFYQSARFQMILIIFTWISSHLYHLRYYFTEEIVYNSDNQICQLPLRLSFSMFYMSIHVYFVPVSLIFFIYLKLVLYEKKMHQHIMPANTLFHAKNELKMVRRTVILVSSLIIYCCPYAIFMFWSFFSSPPKYHFRISYIFIDTSYLIVMIILYQFTDPLKVAIKRKFTRLHNTLGPTTA